MASAGDCIELARQELDSLDAAELAAAGILFPPGKYVPSILYPPLERLPDTDPQRIFDLHVNPPYIPYSGYVHLPFCSSRCAYCHWVCKANPSVEEIDDYLDTIEIEMRLIKHKLKLGRIPLRAVLFGGGTPTYLSPRQLERVIGDFRRHFDLENCVQFTVEAEPGTLCGEVGRERLQVLKDHGVDRICLGVQSFEDHLLKLMGRTHTGADAREAIERIRQSGIKTVGIDLIYGYPSQSLEDWINTIKTALACGVDAWHIFRLRIQRTYGDVQGSIIELHRRRPELFPDVETIHLMKALVTVISEAHGYNHLTVRNFARSFEHVSHYQLAYCSEMNNFFAIGPSGWSSHYRTFTQNTADSALYRRLVREGELPIDRGIYWDEETHIRRWFLSPLKLDRVDRYRYAAMIGMSVDEKFGPELNRLKSYGLIDDDGRTISLSRRGRFFDDETVIQLYQRKYLPFPELAHSLMVD